MFKYILIVACGLALVGCEDTTPEPTDAGLDVGYTLSLCCPHTAPPSWYMNEWPDADVAADTE